MDNIEPYGNKFIARITAPDDAYWVMDKSGSYVPLDDIDDNTTLYGTYIKEEIEITSETPYITKLHYIHAL
mgnify:CR=1 FL=1